MQLHRSNHWHFDHSPHERRLIYDEKPPEQAPQQLARLDIGEPIKGETIDKDTDAATKDARGKAAELPKQQRKNAEALAKRKFDMEKKVDVKGFQQEAAIVRINDGFEKDGQNLEASLNDEGEIVFKDLPKEERPAPVEVKVDKTGKDWEMINEMDLTEPQKEQILLALRKLPEHQQIPIVKVLSEFPVGQRVKVINTISRFPRELPPDLFTAKGIEGIFIAAGLWEGSLDDLGLSKAKITTIKEFVGSLSDEERDILRKTIDALGAGEEEEEEEEAFDAKEALKRAQPQIRRILDNYAKTHTQPYAKELTIARLQALGVDISTLDDKTLGPPPKYDRVEMLDSSSVIVASSSLRASLSRELMISRWRVRASASSFSA